MLDENDRHEAAGTLTYNSEWNSFELDGYELHGGQSMEVSVFGYMLPHGGEPTTEHTDAAKRSLSAKAVWRVTV